MLKVRCKGFEGKLDSMGLCSDWNAETEEFDKNDNYYIRIELDGNTNINLQNVEAEEIEIFNE